MVIIKSDLLGVGKKPRLQLGCERFGHYRTHHSKNKERKGENVKRRPDTATRKCNCPFLLKGDYLGEDKWKVIVSNGKHNHYLPHTLEGHPYAARLLDEEKKLLQDMTLAGV